MTSGDPTPPDEPHETHGPLHVSRFDSTTEAALRRGWHEAVKDNAARYNAAGHLAQFHLPFETYAPDVLRLWLRGRERLALPVDEQALQGSIDRMHHADLYLARACNAGDDNAWNAFVTTYELGLTRLVARHASRSDAERVSTAVIADLSLPPPSAKERTLLGTYEGTGSMWGWLTAIAVRRARKARRPREFSLQEDDSGEASHDASGTDSTADWNEELLQFASALKAAWTELETREQVALVLKFRDGRTQREIATLLRSTPPTMTRVIHQAIAKLRGRLAPEGSAGMESGGLWTRFEATLASHLEKQVSWQREDNNA